MKKPLYVTQPHLPKLEDFIPYLEQIWDNKILTNNGPMHQELEKELGDFLEVPYLSLFNNATTALLAAIQALEIKGEVITTPFTFAATSHCLIRSNITPVFVDIEMEHLNIDHTKIEQAITENTSAILPVHCYGNPCNTEEIKKIAEKHRLYTIYDAAHAFGVKDSGGSILRHGDLSVISFHATKIFNTFEGGAVICKTKEQKERIDLIKNFGILNETTILEAGINGKMNEISAAFGLLQLKNFEKIIQKRTEISHYYTEKLNSTKGIKIIKPKKNISANNSYYPILIKKEFKLSRDALFEKLKENKIFSRRYFYPALPELPPYKNLKSSKPENIKNSVSAAREILCLPIHTEMEQADAERVISTIINAR